MGAWKQIAALPNPRFEAASCFHDGKVYVFGGQAARSSSSVSYETTTYIYDPAANTWSTGAPLPASGLCYAFSTADDGIHVIYPQTRSHYAYDPAANTWATRQSVPSESRRDAHHFTDAAGRIYLAGGRQAAGGSSTEVHRYDPVTDSWSTRPALPSGLANRGPLASPGVPGNDSKVYVGTASFAAGLLAYDPATDGWAMTSDMPDASSGLDVGVSRLPSGMVVTLPHVRFAGVSGTEVLRRVDGYTGSTSTWSMGVIPDFPASTYQHAVATEPGGLIYLLGGLANNSSGVSFTTSSSWAYKQNEPPTAPTPRTLTGGVTVSTGATNRASWTFNDPNAGDSQSKFNFYLRPTGTTTWDVITRTTPNPWYDIPAGSLDPVEYEWQVEVYDAAGEISPRTTSAIFTADDPPDGPSITSPINGQIVEQFETVTWSAPVQDSYQLRRVADDAGDPDMTVVYFDTGEVAEPLTRSLQVEFDVNDRFEHVQVRVKDGGLWSDWVDVQVDVSYTEPPAPTFTVYPDPSTGSLLLMIVNPAPEEGDPAAAYNDVWVDDGAGFERKATELATNSSWRYWTPVSGRDYAASIRVVAVAANGTTSSSGDGS